MAFLANPSGRLIHLERKSRKMTVLLDNLWFANGVALSANEDFIVVSDLGRSKLVKYWLKTEKVGQSETFVDGLPGVPDNLTPDTNGIWVALALAADPQNPALSQSMAPLPFVRKFHVRVLTLIELLFSSIDSIFPNDFCKFLADKVGSGDSVKFMYPPRATILRLDWNGNIIAAYHSFDGAVYTHVLELNGHLYLGSIFNDYIAKVVRRAHL